MLRTSIFLVISSLYCVTAASDPAFLADVFIRRLAKDSKIPGLAVGVVKGEETVFTGGYGVTEHGGTVPVDRHTLFQMGSCTKTFIALGLGVFVTRRNITWDTSVHTITKGRFNASTTYLTQHLNVGDLLSHRSGYGNHAGDSVWILGDVGTEEELVMRRIPALQQASELRQTFAYSNIGYEIATIALEALAGEPWYDFVTRTFLEPLGMANTVMGLGAPGLNKTRLAGGHYGTFTADYEAAKDNLDISSFGLLDPSTPSLTGGINNGYFGAGSAISSVEDYCKWLAFLLNADGQMGSDATAFGKAESAQMVIPHAWAEAFMGLDIQDVGNALGAGFGFDVVGNLFHNQRFFTKGGDTLFHKTRTGFLPAAGVAAVVFSSMEQYPTTEYYCNGIRNALLQIFTGVSMDEVEADWRKIETIVNAKNKMEEIPVSTTVVPLRGGRNVTLKMKAEHAMITLKDVQRVVNATDTDGQLPPAKAATYAGIFTDAYSGTLHVTQTDDGRPFLHYGYLWCILSFTHTKEGGDYFLCANGTLHTAAMGSYLEATFIPADESSRRGDTWAISSLQLEFSREGEHDSAAQSYKPMGTLPPTAMATPMLVSPYIGLPVAPPQHSGLRHA